MARAIDADEFIRIVELIDERYDLSGLRGVYPRRVLTSDGLIFLINRLPTIDPVKHGKWIDKSEWHGTWGVCRYECSCCGYTIPRKPFSRGDGKGSKYCDECGARMDGD